MSAEVLDRGGPYEVEHSPPGLLRRHDPGLVEDGEVSAHEMSGYADRVGYVAGCHARGTDACEEDEDLQTRGLSQRAHDPQCVVIIHVSDVDGAKAGGNDD